MAQAPTDNPSLPMVNAAEGIRSDPSIRRFEVDDILFAELTCPEEQVGIWMETDCLVHVLSGALLWRAATATSSVGAGETAFLKKGAYVLQQRSGHLCFQMYFVPDSVVRKTIVELTRALPARPSAEASSPSEMVLPVVPDTGMSAFLRAMSIYFASDEDPPQALLRVKLTELLTSILLSRINPALSAYLWSMAKDGAPPIDLIMEANYQHNLPLEAFAKMCHRSLSSFKRDFRKHYGESPGKWLLERRLARSISLLRTTRWSVTHIMLECGFVELSHFSKAFKERFGSPPSAFRASRI